MNSHVCELSSFSAVLAQIRHRTRLSADRGRGSFRGEPSVLEALRRYNRQAAPDGNAQGTVNQNVKR
jgi:hypothetical protein